MIATALFAAAAALGVSAAPLQERSTVLTGQYTCATSGDYTLCQNQWGSANGVGSQNSTLVSTSGTDIAWTTTYTWANNPNDVKTYANVLNNNVNGVTLSSVTSLPTTWDWSYTSESSGLRADVSYDMWLGTSSTGTATSSTSEYEIMVWLSGLGGIQPVGSLLTSNIEIDGYTWNLWSGPNSNWEVYSFIPATSGTSITSFNTNLLPFFTYLVDNEGVSTSLYLNAIQTGTEAFTGTASLDTTTFSVQLN
ncbi:endo-beta-1-4-glucanase [Dacryopinax primogenitus]|uniref:Endo-beta-1-4-glucanase n=1 Tax=Dacryopinax primogenitus (strain DJM 731) TaxID=1858805 RepID=M5FV44_DACPD|nr:endo-beta-1-4-glucanase [Dacryopinax primogenitus]EJT99464.1 endo-beta-1-4-glucanase [Dacryopinax primogenitus]